MLNSYYITSNDFNIFYIFLALLYYYYLVYYLIVNNSPQL